MRGSALFMKFGPEYEDDFCCNQSKVDLMMIRVCGVSHVMVLVVRCCGHWCSSCKVLQQRVWSVSRVMMLFVRCCRWGLWSTLELFLQGGPMMSGGLRHTES